MTPEEEYLYHKRWRLDRARGITRYVDPEPTRMHIAGLIGAGASYRAIADSAGVSVHAVTNIHKGQKNIRRDTAAKILTVTAHQIRSRDHGDKFVPDLGTRRRIRAMMALGHSHAAISTAAGWEDNPRAVANLLHQRGTWVTQAKHEDVAEAYRALFQRSGSSKRTKTVAHRRGYPGPMAWEDIDDPDETPSDDVDELANARDRRSHRDAGSVNTDSLADCADWGLTTLQAAHRLGVTQSSIEHGIARHAPELHDRFTQNAIVQEYRHHKTA